MHGSYHGTPLSDWPAEPPQYMIRRVQPDGTEVFSPGDHHAAVTEMEIVPPEQHGNCAPLRKLANPVR